MKIPEVVNVIENQKKVVMAENGGLFNSIILFVVFKLNLFLIFSNKFNFSCF